MCINYCKCGGQLTGMRRFNLMFKTFMGPVEDASATVFMRPETAQGIFVNFLNVQQAARLKPPFGIAQVGKSFRNEITPGNFTYRTREFEQMEKEPAPRPPPARTMGPPVPVGPALDYAFFAQNCV